MVIFMLQISRPHQSLLDHSRTEKKYQHMHIFEFLDACVFYEYQHAYELESGVEGVSE